VAPELAIGCLTAAGWPSVWAEMLGHVWLGQKHWLQWGSHTLPQCANVSQSMPQGDSFSPLALNVVLSAPVRAMTLQERAEGFSQAAFLDDRTFVASTATQARRVFVNWCWWSRIFGLEENNAKLKIVPRTCSQRADLLMVGFDASTVVDQTHILGVDFCSKLNTGQRGTAQQRLEEARLVSQRLCRAKSIPTKTKLMLWQTRVVPKATWGHFFHVPKMSQLYASFKQCMFAHKQGAPDLQKILYGHRADLDFMAGFYACGALRRVMMKGMLIWEQRPTRGTWQSTVRRWLDALGWREVAPWHWTHDALRYFMRWSQLVPLRQVDRSKLLEKFDHLVRESWRFCLFSSFLQRQRRDARALRDAAY